jgi:hypothetical protein
MHHTILEWAILGAICALFFALIKWAKSPSRHNPALSRKTEHIALALVFGIFALLLGGVLLYAYMNWPR